MINSFINSNVGNIAFGSVLGGAGHLTWASPGSTLTLNLLCTYTGETKINNGILQPGFANALPTGTIMTVTTPGVFNLNVVNTQIGALNGTGNVTLQAQTLTLGNTGNASTYSGVISGTGGLTKVGTGTQTLTGANTYTGNTAVNVGTLTLNNALAIPLTNIVTIAAGATMNYNTTGNFTHTGTITPTGTGRFVKLGTGVMTLNSTLTTATGFYEVSNGFIRLFNIAASSASAKYSVINPGVLMTTSNVGTYDLGELSGSGNLRTSGAGALGVNTFSIGGANTSSTFSGVIENNGGITAIINKVGTGTLTLTGTNTYTGATNVNAGTLAITGGTVPAANTLNIAAGATLNYNTASITHSGPILPMGTGIFIKSNAGSNTWSGNNSTATGVFEVQTGDVRLVNATSTSTAASYVLTGTSRFVFDSAVTYGFGSVTGTGTMIPGATTDMTASIGAANTNFTFGGIFNSGAGVIRVIKVGTGNMTLTGASPNIGSLTINAGTVTIGNGGTAVLIPNTLAIANNGTLAFNHSDNTAAYLRTGIISGTGGINHTGTGATFLNSNNTFTGPINITAGRLSLGGGANLPAPIPVGNAIFIGPAGRLDIVCLTFAQTRTGIISGSGLIIKQAAQNLTINGANTFSGTWQPQASSLTTFSSNATALGNGSTYTMTTNCTLTFTVSHTGTVAVTVPAGATVNRGGFAHPGVTFTNTGGTINA